jgi:hypothetical protein
MSSMFEKQVIEGHYKDGHRPINFVNLEFKSDGSNRPAGMFGNRQIVARAPIEAADMVVKMQNMLKYPHMQNTFL